MKIVIIDDNEADRYLARRAIKAECSSATFVEYEAAYLAVDDFADHERFNATFGNQTHVVVLLDINMPRMTGFEFLERVSDSVDTEQATFVMFTSSNRDSDREHAESFDLVRGFATKPLVAQRVRELSETIGSR